MEKVTAKLIGETLENEKRSDLILSNEHSLLIPDAPEETRARLITEIIVQVEMAKQLPRPLTDQERNVLMRLLADSNESIEKIKDRARRVMRRYTYGNIAFEHWMQEDEGPKVKGDCIYCGSEWWGPVDQKCPKCFP